MQYLEDGVRHVQTLINARAHYLDHSLSVPSERYGVLKGHHSRLTSRHRLHRVILNLSGERIEVLREAIHTQAIMRRVQIGIESI